MKEHSKKVGEIPELILLIAPDVAPETVREKRETYSLYALFYTPGKSEIKGEKAEKLTNGLQFRKKCSWPSRELVVRTTPQHEERMMEATCTEFIEFHEVLAKDIYALDNKLGSRYPSYMLILQNEEVTGGIINLVEDGDGQVAYNPELGVVFAFADTDGKKEFYQFANPNLQFVS